MLGRVGLYEMFIRYIQLRILESVAVQIDHSLHITLIPLKRLLYNIFCQLYLHDYISQSKSPDGQKFNQTSV